MKTQKKETKSPEETSITLKKFEPIFILDYIILAQLAISILSYHFIKYTDYSNYKAFIVLFSFIVFFSYWLIRIIFNPKYKELISN